MSYFRDGLDEYDQAKFDYLVKLGCSEESVEIFITNYDVFFDSAWEVLIESNQGINLSLHDFKEKGPGEKEDEKKTEEYPEMNEQDLTNNGEIYPEMNRIFEERENSVYGIDNEIDMDKEFPSMKNLKPDKQ